MSKTATSTVRVEIIGDGAAPYNDSDVNSNTSATAPTSFAATSTYAQVTIPANVRGVKIKPDPSNTNAIYVAGAAADVGIKCDPVIPTFLGFATASPGPLYIKLAAGTATLLLVWS